jgi:hypothetical protein
MAGTIRIGGNTIATHAGSEGAGTVTLDSSTLTIGSNVSLTSATFPAGHVIQTVHSSNDYEIAYTGDTSVHDIESSSGVTWVASITTSSTSNHIVVIPTMYIASSAAVTDNRGHLHGLMDKNGAGYAQVHNGYYAIGVYDFGSSGVFSNLIYNPIFRVSPNFAGVCNFKFTITPNNANSEIKFNYPSTTQEANIILMEIKG